MAKNTPTRPKRGPGVYMIHPAHKGSDGEVQSDALVYVSTASDPGLGELEKKAGYYPQSVARKLEAGWRIATKAEIAAFGKAAS